MRDRDVGIRALIPGQRSPDEIKEDQNTKKYIETIVNRSPRVTPEPLRETLVRTTPSLNLELKPKDSTKEPESFISEKEYQNHLIKSPSKQDHERAFSMGRALLKVPEAEKNKMADEWMRSGGRDPNGRSLDQEIKLGKDMWLEKQRVAEKKKDYPRVMNKADPLLEAAELKKAEMLVSKANARMVTQLTNLKNWANNSKKVVR